MIEIFFEIVLVVPKYDLTYVRNTSALLVFDLQNELYKFSIYSTGQKHIHVKTLSAIWSTEIRF